MAALADQSTLNKLSTKFNGKIPGAFVKRCRCHLYHPFYFILKFLLPLVRVHFLDNSSKVFLLDGSSLIKELLLQCLEKCQVNDPSSNLPYYGIFESKNGGSIDCCLEMDGQLSDIIC